uniref:Secreted protein n=1 Tax=Hydatigena taeniaeformis TaxID=6205 RepID=A0A0R3WX72_HYDTA
LLTLARLMRKSARVTLLSRRLCTSSDEISALYRDRCVASMKFCTLPSCSPQELCSFFHASVRSAEAPSLTLQMRPDFSSRCVGMSKV